MISKADQNKQTGEGAAFRQELRRERIAAREALAPVDHVCRSTAVIDHLRGLLNQYAPAVLAFYSPIRAEVDCTPLVHELLGAGWRACLPVILERHSAMAFREWTPNSGMVTGEYGIPTVSDSAANVVPDIVLLPVNVVDRQGFRLGYGGGYFDRTLAALKPRALSIGVGFDLAWADSIAPSAQDFPLDAVVTESGVERFSAPLPAKQL